MTTPLKEKVLEENRRVHALENQLYLSRHPEQTNFFQNLIVEKNLDQKQRLIKICEDYYQSICQS